jgi:hypothetical protein
MRYKFLAWYLHGARCPPGSVRLKKWLSAASSPDPILPIAEGFPHRTGNQVIASLLGEYLSSMNTYPLTAFYAA